MSVCHVCVWPIVSKWLWNGLITMECEYKTVPKVSNDAIFSGAENAGPDNSGPDNDVPLEAFCRQL